MNILSKSAAVAFFLWGVLHVVGSVAILLAALRDPAAGYAFYANAAESYDALSGGILKYFSFLLLCIAIVSIFIAVKYNWKNSQAGLAANTVLLGLTDIGLIIFMVVPGHVSWAEASIGLALFIVAVITGGIACNAQHPVADQN